MKELGRHRARALAAVTALAACVLPLMAGAEPGSSVPNPVGVEAEAPDDPASLEGRPLGEVELADGRALREAVILEASATHLRLRHADGIARVGFGDLPRRVRALVLDAFTAAAASASEPPRGETGPGDPDEGDGDWHPFLPDPVSLRPILPAPEPSPKGRKKNGATADADEPALELSALQEEIAAIDKRIAELKADVKHYRARHASARARGRISSWSAEASRRQRWVAIYEKENRLRKIRASILAGILSAESAEPGESAGDAKPGESADGDAEDGKPGQE